MGGGRNVSNGGKPSGLFSVDNIDRWTLGILFGAFLLSPRDSATSGDAAFSAKVVHRTIFFNKGC